MHMDKEGGDGRASECIWVERVGGGGVEGRASEYTWVERGGGGGRASECLCTCTRTVVSSVVAYINASAVRTVNGR